ncbi:hypothetical protein D3C80_1836770 [compost metagenome]
MIGAPEKLAYVTVAVCDEFCAFVRATVVMHVYLAVGRTNHDDILITNSGGVVVTRVLDLTFMTYVNPRMAVDALHLEFEQDRVGVNTLVHAVVPDQVRDLFVSRNHHFLS